MFIISSIFDLCLHIKKIPLDSHVANYDSDCQAVLGFVALTWSARTQLVTTVLASMSDSWNIRICVAKHWWH